MAPRRSVTEMTTTERYELLRTMYGGLQTTNELLQDVEREICRLVTVKIESFPLQFGPQNHLRQYRDKGLGDRGLFKTGWRDWAIDNGLLGSVYNVDRRLEKANASKMKLARIQEALRCCINNLSRPSLRSLSILDLPDEVLLSIFRTVEDPDPDSPFIYGFGPGRKDIQNTRLVCRRFCNVSSELLVRFVSVGFDELSLARFEEISRHPTIAKGVRAVRVVLHFYNFSFTDFDFFVSYHADEVERQDNMFDYLRNLCNISAQTTSDRRARGGTVTSILRRLVSTVAVDHGGHPEDEKYRVRLNDVHRQYLLLLDKQESLVKSGRFSRAVGSAIAKMPAARKLVFGDGDFKSSKERTLMRCGADGWGSLYRYMLEPMAGYLVKRDGLELPSYQCISTTISAIRSAGVLLDSVNVDISTPGCPGALVPAQDIRPVFSSGMQQLKEFVFRCEDSANRQEADDICKFLSTCLDTSSLQELSLDFRNLEGEAARVNVGHIMGSKSRYTLTDIFLRHVAMDLSELVLFLKRLPQPMAYIHLDDFRLLSGTWSEALDALRNKRSRIALLAGPSGAECDDMSRADYERIFGNGTYGKQSEAELYIGNQILLPRNPLQTLEEGSNAAD